jgi:predicted RNA-binding protein with PUA-like domain
MAHWLLKTEPKSYSWTDLVKKGAKGDVWSGVRNFIAKSNLTKMKKGERVFFYHTGDEKQIVGVAEVTREHYPDPTDPTGKFVAVDVKAVAPLPRPVTLAEIKADKRLKDMVLVRQARLSVQPVSDAEWTTVSGAGKLSKA